MTTYADKKSLVHTYTTRSFAGTIIVEKTTGKKILKLNAPKYYNHEINKFKENTGVSLVVTSQQPKRTGQQNRYYWLYLTQIGEQTGEQDIDRLHELFKGLFLTKEIVKVLGHDVRIKKSTTELSVSDFCDYILAIQEETGVQAPPTESYNLAPLHQK